MGSKYKLAELGSGWAVEMTANRWVVETFKTKQAAQSALEEFERGQRFVNEKMDVWVIGDGFVIEPSVCGQQQGEVDTLDMSQFNVVDRLTEEEFDALVEAFYKEHGHYPDE